MLGLLYKAVCHRRLSLLFRRLVKHIPNNNPILKIISLYPRLAKIWNRIWHAVAQCGIRLLHSIFLFSPDLKRVSFVRSSRVWHFISHSYNTNYSWVLFLFMSISKIWPWPLPSSTISSRFWLIAGLTLRSSFCIWVFIGWSRLEFGAASVAAQYIATHPQPLHNPINLGLFAWSALKSEFLCLYRFLRYHAGVAVDSGAVDR